MEYGVLVPQGWRLDLTGVQGDAEKWRTCDRVIRGLDEAGWQSLWVFDHFHTFPRKQVEATFEAWTMMANMAAITSRARIGQLVTCNEYRHPAYLAKIAACVDVMSGGRLDLGIGAGWFAEEFEAFGYDFRTIGARLKRLGESLEILRRLWGPEETVTFEGKHFKLVDAICQPRPLQSPRIPIVIGGRGEKVLLRLVARYADVWNYNGSQDEFPRYKKILQEHCLAVGRDFDEIKITAMSGGIAFDDDAEKERFFTRIQTQGFNPDSLLGFVACHGTRERCAEVLSAWKGMGVHGIVFFFNDIASFGSGDSQAEIFRRDILSQV
ncbi:MAG TPA: TIGR03560 family F420-dependent LLM class oxidoreductase [Candidatus Limnocylindrales bacterium]|nr:TIGR03560 family F420-dependent LLM class oxidoreductase [Candidatus Limnocylindrales bacterium]